MAQLDQLHEPQLPSDRGPRLQALALALFDQATAAHRLPARARPLLQLAAAFHALARQSGSEHPHRTGRDMVLAAPNDSHTPEEQAIVASVVALQRGKDRKSTRLNSSHAN